LPEPEEDHGRGDRYDAASDVDEVSSLHGWTRGMCVRLKDPPTTRMAGALRGFRSNRPQRDDRRILPSPASSCLLAGAPMVGWSETLEVLPAILVVGGSFSLTQLPLVQPCRLEPRRHRWRRRIAQPRTVILPPVSGQPKRAWRFRKRAPPDGGSARRSDPRAPAYAEARSSGPGRRSPILSIVVLLWGLPSIKGVMNRAHDADLERALPAQRRSRAPPRS